MFVFLLARPDTEVVELRRTHQASNIEVYLLDCLLDERANSRERSLQSFLHVVVIRFGLLRNMIC